MAAVLLPCMAAREAIVRDPAAGGWNRSASNLVVRE